MGARLTLGRIAAALGATLEGDQARVIRGGASLDSTPPEHVSPLVDPRSERVAVRSRASIDDRVQVGHSCNVGEDVIQQEFEDGRHV